MLRFRRYPELLVIALVAGATHFWQLFYPRAVVFDEVHFKGFAAQYFTGNYYFDVHPPLGKLLYAGEAWIQGLNPAHMASQPEVSLRILPALAGTLLVLVIWAMLRALGTSRKAAAIGSLLVALDGALLVQSRFATLDVLVLLFGFGAIYAYLRARKSSDRHQLYWYGICGLSGGAAVSTKWSGLSALGVVGVLWAWDHHRQLRLIRRYITGLLLLVGLPIMLYIGSFWVHFALLPRSGPGDAFMSQTFQSGLIGNAYYTPGKHQNFLQKFGELNTEMLRANGRIPNDHPYGSRWYTWPYLARPIYYWQGDVQPDGKQGNIYLLGNPIIWWGILFAVPLGLLLASQYRGGLRPRTSKTLVLLTLGYATNFVPYIAFGRVTFIYYYFAAFIFSILATVVIWDDVLYTGTSNHQRHFLQKLVGTFMIAVVLSFCFFAPILYGWSLTPDQLQTHMWLRSWR